MQDARDVLHVGLTAITAWLGLYLDLAKNLFATHKDFTYMAAFASEHTWAIVLLASANIGVLGLVAASVVIRLASVLVVTTVIGAFAGCLFMSHASIWSGTYIIIAGMGYYLAYRKACVGL